MDTPKRSSSPDPLAYPGDPEFLLSSAMKPFSQRRLSMTPFKPRTPRNPWSTKAKVKSTKGATSIKYPDIILPSTPSGDRFRRKSLSPTKTTLHSENNISPWRIRVTLEAERDDEEGGETSVGQTAVGNWTNGNTLMIPMKTESSPARASPKKRSGKPKNPSISNRVPTPRKKQLGEPSNVPHTGGKRKRGRPRKTIEPTEENSPIRDISPTKSIGQLPSGDDLFLDIAQSGVDNEGTSGTPITHPLQDAHFDTEISTKQHHSSPRVDVTGTSNALNDREGSSPLGTTFPVQIDSRSSPINAEFAGHTPRPKVRLYPTPTSSSQLDDEIDTADTASKKGRIIADPTEEHREFDSIMESEGFSMVTLNSLPSAQQNLLGSLHKRPARKGSTKGILQPSSRNKAVRSADPTTHIATALSVDESFQNTRSMAAILSPEKVAEQHDPIFQHVGDAVSLHATTTTSKPTPGNTVDRRPLVRLVRIVKVGISLQRMMNRNAQLEEYQPIPNIDLDSTRQRLDGIFADFSVDIQRDLFAGVRFGEELAQRIREAHKKRRIEPADNPDHSTLQQEEVQYPLLDIAVDGASSDFDGSQPDKPMSPVDRGLNGGDNLTETIDLEMAKREAEWQREREAISSQIEAANASQVIIIDSDDDDANSAAVRHLEVERNESSNSMAVYDDDYEDIWQQEAREAAVPSESPSFADVTHDDTVHPRLKHVTTMEDVGYEQGEELLPDLAWSALGKKYPLMSFGKSQLAKYRDKDFEFSSLIGTPESSTKRFIQGGSVSVTSEPHPHQVIAKEKHAAEPNSVSVKAAREATPDIKDLPRSERAQSISSGSISELPPPPSLKYTGSDLMTNDQEGLSPANQSPPPLLGTQNQSQWDDSGRSQVAFDDVQKDGLDMGDIVTVSPDVKPPECATPASRWYDRITGLAPKWLAATRTPQDKNQDQLHNMIEPASPQSVVQKPSHQSHPAAHRRKQPASKQLALSGYFTDDHYVALRHVYHQAKQSPHLFPFVSTPEREAMLGKWMWSVDGHQYRQVTEIQLAIVDKFGQDLVNANRRRGGSDNLGWSEEDILWRLFSIIVGEKLRRERKRQYAAENRMC
ncbi:hypothetical protein LOZ66_000737 [Ophidiomyces ophidiicola]|nr:hypothetical protein LOZ66_000737 [Ophidiomyces ophidiicola]